MDSRAAVPDFFERQVKPRGPGRLFAIPPLAVAVAVILLGFLIYHSLEIAMIGIGLVLVIVSSLFYLESRDERGMPTAPIVLERGDWVALLLGMPSLLVLGIGFWYSSGWVILLGFCLMLIFFVVMGVHDRESGANSNPVR